MAVFKNYDELYMYISKLYDDAKCDARIAPKIKDSNLVIQFRYDDPAAIVTINAAKPPTQPGAYFDVLWGEVPMKPDVEMSMKADVAHQFWHGKINLMAALARRQIVAKGPIPKILKLLPAVEPMYDMYPRILSEMGRNDLVLP
jgi:putative sterol carrier protein